MLDSTPERKNCCSAVRLIVIALILFGMVASPILSRSLSIAPPSLASQMNIDNMMQYLTTLNDIADANGGSRAAPTGYNASIDYFYSVLTAEDVGAYFDVQVQNFTVSGGLPTSNLIATTRGGNSSNMITVGAHFDSVMAGPGINDDGSGSAMNLELAVQMAKLGLQVQNQVRFIWFGGHEVGHVGSRYYVNNLTASELAQSSCMLQFDMVGSTNYYIGVYGNGEFQGNGISNIQSLLAAGVESQSQPWGWANIGYMTDSAVFLEHGIPAAGIFTGAFNAKTQDQYDTWGGIVGVQYDPCYHSACDTTSNIDQNVYIWNARAGASALEALLSNTELRVWLNLTITPPVPTYKGGVLPA